MSVDVKKQRNTIIQSQIIAYVIVIIVKIIIFKSTYPLVEDYLALMGIDIEKPFELSFLEPDLNGINDIVGFNKLI